MDAVGVRFSLVVAFCRPSALMRRERRFRLAVTPILSTTMHEMVLTCAKSPGAGQTTTDDRLLAWGN